MCAQDSVLLSKERCHKRNARREKIFNDMSYVLLSVVKEIRVNALWSATPMVLRP